MVKLICGLKGTGKTKRIIEMANADGQSGNNEVVFIEAKNKHILDLKHNIRYINAMEFNINDIETFHGFLCGLIAENYDIRTIYIDGIYRLVNIDFKGLSDLIKKLEELNGKFRTEFVLTLNYDPKDIPENLKTSVI